MYQPPTASHPCGPSAVLIRQASSPFQHRGSSPLPLVGPGKGPSDSRPAASKTAALAIISGMAIDATTLRRSKRNPRVGARPSPSKGTHAREVCVIGNGTASSNGPSHGRSRIAPSLHQSLRARADHLRTVGVTRSAARTAGTAQASDPERVSRRGPGSSTPSPRSRERARPHTDWRCTDRRPGASPR